MLRKNIFFSVLAFIVVFALFSSFALEVEAAAAKQGTVSSSSSLNVRAAASTSSERIGVLQPGATIEIVSTSGDFYEIRFQGKRGFVHKDYVRLTTASGSSPSSNDITIYVNGEKLALPISKVPLENNSVLVPFRVIGEALGIDVRWISQTRQVSAKDGGTEVLFTLNQERTLVNKQTISVKPAPRIVEKSTVIPLRFFAETFGADVSWNQAKKEVRINRTNSVPPPSSGSGGGGAGGYKGIVNRADTLNVRSGPSQSHASLGNLARGAKVEVSSFTDRWAQITYNGKNAYVHSYYLDLTLNGKAFRMLGQPAVSESGQSTSVTWPKIGGTITTSHTQSGQTITIQTEATALERLSRSIKGISTISYGQNQKGQTITFQVASGYQATISHTVGEVILNVSPKVTGQTLSGKKIVIDAGHGGSDPGASGHSLKEKDIVLDVSLRVEKLLRDAGAHVIMTRDRDIYPTLTERVKLANDAKADIFISIHTNSATPTATGTETYWNATYAAGESKRLASAIQKRLIERLGTRDRGVKEGNFQVIRTTKMPSVLLELAFISNSTEAELMKTDAFRQNSAQAIYDGLVDFYK